MDPGSNRPLPILALSAKTLGQLDPNDTEALSSLWTVFTKCAQSIENGRRLENMSWRLWNREVLYSPDDNNNNSDVVPSLEYCSSGESMDSVQSTASQVRERSRPKQLSSEQLQKLFRLFQPGEDDPLLQAIRRCDSNSSNSLDTTAASALSRTHLTNSHPQTSAAAATPTSANNTANNTVTNSATNTATSSPTTPRTQHAAKSTAGHSTRARSSFSGQRPATTARRLSSGKSSASLANLKSQKTPSTSSPAPSQPRTSVPAPHPTPAPQALPHTSVPTASNGAQSQTSAHASNGGAQAHTSVPSSNGRSRASSLFQRAPVRRPSPPSDGTANEDTHEVSSDSDLDSDISDGELEPSSPEDQTLSYRNRSTTSTSIVRGFNPSNISVSFVNRSPEQPSDLGGPPFNPQPDTKGSSDTGAPGAGTGGSGKMVKAPVPREKMFFIESSPSDNDDVGGSVSTTDEGDRSQRKSPRKYSRSSKHSPSNLTHSLDNEHAITDKDDDNDDDDDDAHEFDDDDDGDSAWDSVDDESDSSFDERQFVVRDQYLHSKPLVKPSRLSSLFLNKPALVQQQQQQQLQKYQQQQSPQQQPAQPAQQRGRSPPLSRLAPALQNVPLNPTENLLNATAQMHAPPPAAAMSPRTTRRNMLATELSSSLRRNLLWERQQPLMYANNASSKDSSQENSPPETSAVGGHSVLKRSRTSTAIADIKPRPGLTRNKSVAAVAKDNTAPWNDDLEDTNADFNYHARGW
uniref:ARAD1D22528p n=1 Tax=Blastobotrys adeninivorans TaxID=409370 RepID=A0A060TFE4_BLAAD